MPFERELRAARGAPKRLEVAFSRYGGDFAASETLGDWHLEIRERARLQHLDGLSMLADLHLAAGEPAAAAAVLEGLIQSDSLREDAHRRLMMCYARSGQRDRALRQYERLTRTLAKELGADPEAESAQLAERIRHAQEV